MSDEAKILDLIKAVREISPLMIRICKEGSCYRFFEVLKAVFPDAKPFYNDEMHVLTKIDGKYYDISGEVMGGNPQPMSKDQIKSQSRYVSDLRLSAIDYGSSRRKQRDRFLEEVDSVA